MAVRPADVSRPAIVAATWSSHVPIWPGAPVPSDMIVSDPGIIMTPPSLSRRAFTLTALASASLLMDTRLTAADTRRILVHGHRGARARRPENTLPAFQYALDQGVDVLELDVAVTKDGVAVIRQKSSRARRPLCVCARFPARSVRTFSRA